MARRLTLKLGFARQVQDVTVVIPDDEPTPWELDERFAVVGLDTPRLDGPLKAAGNARYTYDIELPGMLYGAILRSPYPHARVGKIDLAGARRIPGVRAAIARDDQVVRFAGQEVAAVAAISPQVADDALALSQSIISPWPSSRTWKRHSTPPRL
jgi:xanthine dehydrogenase YagR molybdenum-binding subunit